MEKTKNQSKNYWKLGLSVFWFVVIGVNAVFVYLATSTQSDLVTEDYYQKGVEYQKEIDAKKEFAKNYPEAKLTYSENALSIQFAEGVDSVSAQIYRSDNPAYDAEVALTKDESGVFKSPRLVLAQGPYKIQVSVRSAESMAQKEFKIWAH